MFTVTSLLVSLLLRLASSQENYTSFLSYNCSATNSFVQVLHPDNLRQTLQCIILLKYIFPFASDWKTFIYFSEFIVISSQAYFPPYSYKLSETNLTLLNSNDSVCDNVINTTVTNLVVLIREDSNNCDEIQIVLNLESKGASGVLFYDDEDLTYVTEITINSNTGNYDDPVIPARMITQSDGLQITSTLESGGYVTIEIGCFNNQYPPEICVQDTKFFKSLK